MRSHVDLNNQETTKGTKWNDQENHKTANRTNAAPFTLSLIDADQIKAIVKLLGHNIKGPAFESIRKAIAQDDEAGFEVTISLKHDQRHRTNA